MKNKALAVIPVILLVSISLMSCEAIGGIFKAGMWTGVIAVVIIVVIVIYIISKVFNKNKNG